MGVGPAHPGNVEEQLVVGRRENRTITKRHRTEGVAVISTLEGNQPAPVAALIAPPLPGDLEGHLNGGRAVIGKEEAFELGAFCEPVGQLFGRGVAEVGENHLLQCSGLVPDSCGD